jgi:hypothetical protein
MESKYSLAEQVRKVIQPRLSTDTKVTQQEAMLTVGNVADKLIQVKLYQEYYADGGMDLSPFIQTYKNVTAEYDEEDCEWFAWLPAKPIGLPKASGLVELYVKGYADYPLIRTFTSNRALYRNLDGGSLPRGTYWQENDKIIFGQEMSGKQNLILKMVSQMSDLDDNQELNIDPSMAAEIIQLSVQSLLQVNGQEDINNDNIGT